MCDCLEQFNEQLSKCGNPSGENTRVSTSIHVNMKTGKSDSRPTLVTEKRISRGPKTSVIWPAYCPMCGIKYKEEGESD